MLWPLHGVVIIGNRDEETDGVDINLVIYNFE